MISRKSRESLLCFFALLEALRNRVLRNRFDTKWVLDIFMLAVFLMLIMGPQFVYAEGVLDTAKSYANTAMFWKDTHLKEVTFKELYPKPIYKKSYFSWIILGSTILAGSAVTYFTAGVGAPAAATGVSTVASWIAGGGAGSYMAGLSTVGGFVGGNAIIGATILNGLSYGLIGGTMGKFVLLSSAAKFGVIANITAVGLDGIAVLAKETGRPHYTIRLKYPLDLGSKKVRTLAEEYYENEENKLEASVNGDLDLVGKYNMISARQAESSKELLSKALAEDYPSQEDLLVLAMMNYTAGKPENMDLFHAATKRLSSIKFKLNNSSFIDYLIAIDYLSVGKKELAIKSLDSSINQEPFAIEASLLRLVLLSEDFDKNEELLLESTDAIEENYDSDKYSMPYSLVAPYFRVATVFYNNEKYIKAKEFYERAYDEIGLFQWLFGEDALKTQLQLGIANCYYQGGDKAKADMIFSDITEDMSGNELNNIKEQYAGNKD